MASEAREREDANLISRRVLIKTAGVAGGRAGATPHRRADTGADGSVDTVTTPPRDFGPNAAERLLPIPMSVDPLFNGLRYECADQRCGRRLWSGARPERRAVFV
jgi:hypothetical protein